MINIFKTGNEIRHSPDDVFLHFTGNIFGIGCSAFSENAINKIHELKQRDTQKGFILLFSSIEQIKLYKFPLLENNKLYSLLNQYFPGNLTTILSTDDDSFAHIWQNQKVALRIPKSNILREFITKIGHPIVSTSINISGNPYCTDVSVLHKQFSDWFDYGLYDENEPADQPIPSTLIDIFDNENKDLQIKCLREGSIPFSEIKESFQKPLIQFVCIGNICRSPIAEYYANKRLVEENIAFRVESCGLIENRKLISTDAKTVLKKNGIDSAQRVSIQVDEGIVRRSSLLLCMSKDVKKHLLERFPDAKNKIFTFAEYTGHENEIEDPYGMDFSYFETAFEQIKDYTEDLLKILKGLI
ncbi:MAG: Sua5/YciO/YrdC/YwlC family protein [Candidatus Cloacimonetes bacterium]|nr:Sua5/YciO/YrdC/YwlC family protein [Candidatus Cloacimonadota bacterium]